MKNLKYVPGLLCLFLPLFFFACERPLDYQFEQASIKPVLFVTLQNNGISTARLTYSAPLEKEYKTNRAIEGADIKLYDTDDNFLSFVEEGDGDYSLEYDFDILKGYFVRVNTPYGEVESELVYFFPSPKIEEITLSNYTDSDPPESNDAFLLSIELFVEENIQYYGFDVKGIVQGEVKENIDSRILQSGEIDGPCSPSYLFTNECFVNQSTVIEVALDKYFGWFPIRPEGTYQGYIVEMLSLNESAYEASFYNFEYEFIDLVFSEPAPHYSNVKGGYGVVEAINVTRKVIMIEN